MFCPSVSAVLASRSTYLKGNLPLVLLVRNLEVLARKDELELLGCLAVLPHRVVQSSKLVVCRISVLAHDERRGHTGEPDEEVLMLHLEPVVDHVPARESSASFCAGGMTNLNEIMACSSASLTGIGDLAGRETVCDSGWAKKRSTIPRSKCARQ